MSRYGRPVAGRLNGIHAEEGTLLGPRGLTGETLVVIDNDDRGVVLGYAQAAEMSAATMVALSSPRSVTEHRLRARIVGVQL